MNRVLRRETVSVVVEAASNDFLLITFFGFKADSIASSSLQRGYSCVLHSRVRTPGIGDPFHLKLLHQTTNSLYCVRERFSLWGLGSEPLVKGPCSLLCRKLYNSEKIISPFQRLGMWVYFRYNTIFLNFKVYG